MNQAFWVIYDKYGKEVISFDYRDKEHAEAVLADIKSRAKPIEHYFLKMTKKDVKTIPGKIHLVFETERTVRGVTDNKRTGERSFWIKEFRDFTIYSTTLAGVQYSESITLHHHRMTQRIIKHNDDGTKQSMTANEYLAYAIQRWPENWDVLTDRFN